MTAVDDEFITTHGGESLMPVEHPPRLAESQMTARLFTEGGGRILVKQNNHKRCMTQLGVYNEPTTAAEYLTGGKRGEQTTMPISVWLRPLLTS